MTFAELSSELDRLHGLPFPPSDYQTHWEGLRDMPKDALARAVGKAARACERFPAPAELRALADSQRPTLAVVPRPTTVLAEPVVFADPRLPAPITIDREWRYYCDDCSDTGRESVWCDRHEGSSVTKKPWHRVEQCSMEACRYYPHEWVRRCGCWYTNPALTRKRLDQAKYAEQRTGGRQ